MQKTFGVAMAGIVLAAALSVSNPSAIASDLLTIGSPAPALNVEHWIQDGGGKFSPVTQFEPGKVYVVEFWATWCGPCVASMPHLAELQKSLGDKGVRIISISDEDLETVQEFLDREVRGSGSDPEEDKKTYRQLTSAYSLTTDPDQSSYQDYMEAAAQNGIPTAFVVGKDARVEWIGHPMELEETLKAVIEDRWDREAFAQEIKAQQEAEKAMQEIFALLQKQDFDEAVALIDATLEGKENLQLQMLKLQVLIASEKLDAAATHLQSLYKEQSAQPEVVNMMAWNIYELASQGRIEKGLLIDSSIVAAEAAAKSPAADKEEKASLLDTLAHLHFTNGDLDKAIELESEAVKLSGDRDREFIEGFLQELQELKKNGSQEKP